MKVITLFLDQLVVLFSLLMLPFLASLSVLPFNLLIVGLKLCSNVIEKLLFFFRLFFLLLNVFFGRCFKAILVLLGCNDLLEDIVKAILILVLIWLILSVTSLQLFDKLHKLDELLLWVFLNKLVSIFTVDKLLEFLNKHINVSLELTSIHIRLTLDFILELWESEGIFKLIEAKFISIVVIHSGLGSQ